MALPSRSTPMPTPCRISTTSVTASPTWLGLTRRGDQYLATRPALHVPRKGTQLTSHSRPSRMGVVGVLSDTETGTGIPSVVNISRQPDPA
jgi:hypothetical protein